MLKRLTYCTEKRGDLLIRNLWKHNWLHSGGAYHESWCTIQQLSATGSSPSFPWAWKEIEMPPSLPGPTPSILSLRGSTWWSAWKWCQGSTTKRCRKPRQAMISGKSYSKTAKVKDVHCNCMSHISTSRMSQLLPTYVLTHTKKRSEHVR